MTGPRRFIREDDPPVRGPWDGYHETRTKGELPVTSQAPPINFHEHNGVSR